MNYPQHLLIVEDNRALRQMLTWEFEELGYRVTATDCCSAALAAARAEKMDLGLLDHNLPDGCGMDLVSQLQAINPDMQVILSSGYLNSEECDRALCHFEPKPVSARKLHRLFQEFTGQPIE
ncbi:response regulator [Sedimenticola thiotaurini]|uniref:response regulator n=1 Tax=Sedimenticola thiotaurini TaxID=1543721 RepID=UPI00069C0241|nr:response regulator [Sedimenticola thiotaurini]